MLRRSGVFFVDFEHILHLFLVLLLLTSIVNVFCVYIFILQDSLSQVLTRKVFISILNDSSSKIVVKTSVVDPY